MARQSEIILRVDHQATALFIMFPLLSFMMVVGMLMFNNDDWESSMVRSLGCYYRPFHRQDMDSFSWGPSVGFRSCGGGCSQAEFVLLRGVQCLCLTYQEAQSLHRIADKYCDIQCDDDEQVDDIPVNILCGGNLGGNLYCNSTIEDCELFPTLPEPLIDQFAIPNSTIENPWWKKFLGCGQPGQEIKSNNKITYFPNLHPADCITYCNHEKTVYAHVGWIPMGDSYNSNFDSTTVNIMIKFSV